MGVCRWVVFTVFIWLVSMSCFEVVNKSSLGELVDLGLVVFLNLWFDWNLIAGIGFCVGSMNGGGVIGLGSLVGEIASWVQFRIADGDVNLGL